MWSLVDEDKLKPWTIYSLVIYHKLSNNRGCEQSKHEKSIQPRIPGIPKVIRSGQSEKTLNPISHFTSPTSRDIFQSTRLRTQRTR